MTFRPAASRDFDDLPRSVKERISARLDALPEDPRPPGAIALQGRRGLLRIRVGDYRIVYEVRDDAATVVVDRIDHRKDVYRR